MTNNADCDYNIAKQFSRFPGGRLSKHGPKSGEEFREEVLVPLIEKCESLKIDLSGVVGYGASFLDESFGEIGKLYGYKKLNKILTLTVDDDPHLVSIIWEKIQKGSEEK